MDAVQFHTARPSLHIDSARSCLLQGDAPAASISFKPSSNIGSVDGAAARLGPHIALHVIDVNIAGTSVGAHSVTEVRNLETAGA